MRDANTVYGILGAFMIDEHYDGSLQKALDDLSNKFASDLKTTKKLEDKFNTYNHIYE